MTDRRILPRMGVFIVLAGAACLGTADPAAAAARPPAGVAVSFTAAAAAPVAQITEDEPTAASHPEAEGEYGYTLVTANPSEASALASVLWPGSVAGNAGTLVAVLGGPSNLSALNDPVQASATTGTDQTHSSVSAPSGAEMSASVVPTGPGDEHTTAKSTLAGGGLGGAGSVGSSTSESTIDFDSSTGRLALTARSAATNLDVAGVVKIGSVTSSATATATNGQTPQVEGATSFHDMTVAGQGAYVDGSGVHLGSPGAPAGPAAVDQVDAALAAAGMEVYFTAPHDVTVGGTSYYYAASVLFYWAPPNDPNQNSFTLSVGGAAVSVTDSAQPDTFDLGSTAGTPAGGGGATGARVAVQAPAPPSAPGGTSPSLAGVSSALPGANPQAGGGELSLPASPSAAASRTAGSGGSAALASTLLPGGIGAGWWILAALVALVGAGLTTRVPALLNRQAAAACPRARNPRSNFANRRQPS